MLLDFEQRFKDAVKPYERAHVTMEEYSRRGKAALNGVELIEPAAFGLLLKSAADTHGADRFRLSDLNKRPAEDLLLQDNIVLSAIGMARNDVAALDTVDRGVANTFPLRMAESNGFVAALPNYDAEVGQHLDRADWEQARISALESSLNHGAHIISFGELDYPPIGRSQEEISAEARFVEKLQSRIDAVDRPVFLLAGTRHDFDEGNNTCFNQARILTNATLRSNSRPGLTDDPILHAKLNAANFTKESISVPKHPRVRYYSSILGKIAVLICVDAYNPAVLMSLLANRANRGAEQIDYVLVPSYNFSPKLYYSCQVLSLLSGSVVMLIDACRERADKPAQTAIFVHGRLFSDLIEDHDETLGACGEFKSEAPHSPVRSCSISLDYLRETRAIDDPTVPFLNRVGKLFMSADLTID
ncbi:MAG: hypothetical protein JJ911_07805 [Rhizobiaceae bacterium]|nr:hypothetical protein [Rhizobiaceae bacterium]